MLYDRPERARDLFNKALEIEQNPRWRLRLEDWITNLPAKSDIGTPIDS
jgi:hypothetical protein